MADATEWVWVKDLDTGYRYDIPAAYLDDNGHYDGVQVIASKPRHYGALPRETKFPTDVDTTTDQSRTAPTADAPASGDEAAAAATS